MTVAGVLATALLLFAPSFARADTDDASMAGVNPTSVGLQPLKAPIAVATPYPGESKVRVRPDGAFEAVPDVSGRTKTYRLVARSAPWTLKSGVTVMAKTYNGVVPGPVIDVQRGDNVVIEYRNELDIADTLHMHGIHGTPTSDDGVAGWGQAPVQPHGTFRYTFTANQPGTFMYHTHDREAVLNSGLYGAIIVHDPNEAAAEHANRDYLVFLSSWSIQSTSENHFTINGKEYPDTKQLEVASGENIRIRYVNMSGENFHTMHIHGHEQHLLARDAWPVPGNPLEDTISLGPGQRADVIVPAKAKPGTWMLQCHIMDHVEDGMGMPAGLITALHYKGAPQIFGAMSTAMTTMAMPPSAPQGQGKLSFALTAFLGAFAGLTIFLGLPIARARKLSPHIIAALNAFAIGILVFLVVEIANNAIFPIKQSVIAWKSGSAFPWALSIAMAAGLLVGLVGFGAGATRLAKHGATVSDDPMRLSFIIATGIGAHNFAEGLAIGASAAAGATAIALGLIVGFALHNATEGFGIAAPLAGRYVPSWKQLALAGVIGGGPTFIGTMIGYSFTSPLLSVLFLSTAVGALVFVIGELWSVLKKTGVTFATTSMVPAGFALGLITELIVDINGG